MDTLVESIMHRFLGENPLTAIDSSNPIVIAHPNASIDGIIVYLNGLEISLKKEQK